VRAGGPHLVAHLLVPPPAEAGAAPDDGPPRVGFVVSKAVGGSVVRHRVQRRLRHVVRGRLDRLPRGGLLVVRATPAAFAADSARLADDLDSALARLLRPRSPTGRA
jgi:ribonuclease P protein component